MLWADNTANRLILKLVRGAFIVIVLGNLMTDHDTNISRRRCAGVNIAGITVGAGHPIVVQSMTNTDTADIPSTVEQVRALARAGSEIVRVTVNTEEAAAAHPYGEKNFLRLFAEGWETRKPG